jgi:hypothetical protein
MKHTLARVALVVRDYDEAIAASGGLVNPSESEWRYNGSHVCDGVDPEANVVQFRAPA